MAEGSPRLLSVDVHRGLAVAGMLLVDYQGSEEAAYPALRHAAWNGWTAADLVFPSFLFLVGVSVALSVSMRQARGEPPGRVLRHAARRAVMLVALGVLLNGFPSFALGNWRVLGVVQRIGVCYFAAVALRLWSPRRAPAVGIAVCLAAYWALLRFAPVPGLGVPGRDIPFLDPERNLTAWLDRALFPGRLYHGVRDPEGVLSTLPAIATALAGVLVGDFLLSSAVPRARQALRLGAAGVAAMAAGWLWGRSFPINKNLWTSSYVVFTAGVAMLVLAGLYWLIEVRGARGPWTVPFLVFGMNALLGFVLDMLIYLPLRYPQASVNGWLLSQLSPANASLAYAVAVVLLCWLLLYPLYRARLFLKA
ncbi:MAG TPA: heparan-alpha-glucosaminide N-acetyltransferase domain-containing protein [Vicinamibacteria bacterium]